MSRSAAKMSSEVCPGCEKLRGILLSSLEKIRDIDAVSGEAIYDLCQDIQRRMKDGGPTNRVRNNSRQKGSNNPKNERKRKGG